MIFTIDGTPIPKVRHRSAIRHGRIFCYDSQQNSKTAVSWMLKSQLNNALNAPSTKAIAKAAKDILTANAFQVDFEFHVSPPLSKSTSERCRLLWFGIPAEKPDIDNLVKFYLDAANKVIWPDDKKIVELNAKKIYSEFSQTIMKVTGRNEMQKDENVQGILSIFSPNRYYEMLRDVKFLAEMEGTPSQTPEQRALNAAYIISKFADTYSDELHKIKKKYPGYWKDFISVVPSQPKELS